MQGITDNYNRLESSDLSDDKATHVKSIVLRSDSISLNINLCIGSSLIIEYTRFGIYSNCADALVKLTVPYAYTDSMLDSISHESLVASRLSPTHYLIRISLGTCSTLDYRAPCTTLSLLCVLYTRVESTITVMLIMHPLLHTTRTYFFFDLPTVCLHPIVLSYIPPPPITHTRTHTFCKATYMFHNV